MTDADEWIISYETSQNIIKTVIRMGEEMEELSPGRQRMASVYYMDGLNSMLGVRTFRQGTRTYVTRQVFPSRPDVLIVKLTSGDVTCTRYHRRLADGETVDLT
jgi:hypothetical protein